VGGPESFLARWSRLKTQGPTPVTEPVSPSPRDADAGATGEGGRGLPTIESLDAQSEYRAFLADGVPASLRRLALRKAWSSNPRIAGFRGFADYDWDCNAPGYGRLLPLDDVEKLCAAILRRPESDEAAAASAPRVPQAEHPEPAHQHPDDGEPNPVLPVLGEAEEELKGEGA
jgi:Protein of unknown function (DUF3306)